MKKNDYRAKLAEEFARLLEEKHLDWKKEWQGLDVPLNAKTGKVYKGSNRFYLSMVAVKRGYKDPRWATFRQIQTEGWRLKNAKGQGVIIEYWFPYDMVEKKGLTWSQFYDLREQIGERYQLLTNYFVVFNASLIDGITPYERHTEDVRVDELVNRLSRNMQVSIVNDGGDRAYYRLDEDRIHLPVPESFYSTYAYNSTALHELTHATGAEHRLNRNLSGAFGSPEYAFEELVAEISSCFMSSYLQIDQDQSHIENHKAYVQNWISAIHDQPEILFRAIQQAEKAATYMEYKAELIPEEVYIKTNQSAPKVSVVAPEQIRDTYQSIMLQAEEKIYHLDSETYLYLQTSDEGFDYTFYDRHFRLMDGGRLDRMDLPIEAARDEIIKFHNISPDQIEEIPGDEYEKLRGMVDGEPVVTVTFTESNYLEEGKQLPFSEADRLFEETDRKTRQFYGTEGRYDKTYFKIEYMKQGRLRTYEGRQDMGDLEGSLTDHILSHASYYRNDPDYQSYLLSRGEQSRNEANAIYDNTIHDFIPFLNLHKNLSEIEQNALQSKESILNDRAIIGNPEKRTLDYYDAMLMYVRESRMELNSAAAPNLPDPPELEDYIDRDLEEYKKQLEEEIQREAASYGITVEEYASNGYEPLQSKALMDLTKQGIEQLHADNKYFEDILTVQEYEKSIGREESVLVRSSTEELEKYAGRCEKYLKWGQEVDQCLAGEIQKRNALKVGETPELMIQAGCRALPMHMTQRHLKNIMRNKDDSQPHYHGLTLEEIKRIPEEMEQPAVILQSPSREDSLVIILGYREKDGSPILVSLVPEGEATYNLQRIQSNFITSVYGKEHVREYVERSIEKRQLIYMNKEKSQELALLPLQLRQDHLAPAFDCIIRRINTDVKAVDATLEKMEMDRPQNTRQKTVEKEAAPKL